MKNFLQNLVPSKLTYKLACLCMVAMFAGNAQASFLHSYTGQFFNLFPVLAPASPYTPADNVTIQFRTPDKLNPGINIVAASFLATPGFEAGSATFTAGPVTITDSTAIFPLAIGLEIDASGNVIGYYAAILGATNALPGIAGILPVIIGAQDITANLAPFAALSSVPNQGEPTSGIVNVTNIFVPSVIAEYDLDQAGFPGTWDVQTSVPEPTSLLLLMTGMFGITAAKRRNKGMMATAA